MIVRILKLADKTLAKIEGYLIVLFLGLMVTLTFVQVVLRSLYTHGHLNWANSAMSYIDWTEPFVRLLVLWVTFLGASLLTGDNKHIRIDLMKPLLPDGLLYLRDLILSLSCLLICAFMLKASLGFIRMEMVFGGNLFFKIPVWTGQLILPAGFSFILFRFLLRSIEQFIIIIKGGRT